MEEKRGIPYQLWMRRWTTGTFLKTVMFSSEGKTHSITNRASSHKHLVVCYRWNHHVKNFTAGWSWALICHRHSAFIFWVIYWIRRWLKGSKQSTLTFSESGDQDIFIDSMVYPHIYNDFFFIVLSIFQDSDCDHPSVLTPPIFSTITIFVFIANWDFTTSNLKRERSEYFSRLIHSWFGAGWYHKKDFECEH